jgi:hypothetical protein
VSTRSGPRDDRWHEGAESFGIGGQPMVSLWGLANYLPPYFFGTLAAAAFGAFFGAWVNTRIQTRKVAITELNNINAALALCFSISNIALSLKRQHVLPMKDRYDRTQQDHKKHLADRRLHKSPGPLVFELHADLQTLTPLKMPSELLERCVFDKITISGRALAAAVTLVGSIDGLDKSIKFRNELIAEFAKMSPIPPKVLAEKYLGLR